MKRRSSAWIKRINEGARGQKAFPVAPTLPSPAPSVPPETERALERAFESTTCARCGGEPHPLRRVLVRATDYEGHHLAHYALLCSACAATVFACWEKQTRLTPVVLDPPETKRFCTFCKARVFGEGALCDGCFADEWGPTDG